ncbi:hypothetical protein SAMN02745190_00648 [Schwartzia succinivorans DSM 10502]|jgi:hypothetical protein|uniref:Uncharacterized protein n=1 Tax=Schwartzia succinivorans DSM 10502 TaxID=1123243 RepID=A0A1M4UG92_9FIRM|nr:hypothetical protein SAMN02745190_00648 [Schwartzia succinivorans DSM 10502]
MARCCKCGKQKETPFVFRTDEPLCKDCAAKYELCTKCSRYFEYENMNGSYCTACDMLSED